MLKASLGLIWGGRGGASSGSPKETGWRLDRMTGVKIDSDQGWARTCSECDVRGAIRRTAGGWGDGSEVKEPSLPFLRT